MNDLEQKLKESAERELGCSRGGDGLCPGRVQAHHAKRGLPLNHCITNALKGRRATIVAETITELIRFEPEICICDNN